MVTDMSLKDVLKDSISFDGLGYSEDKENTLKCAVNTLYNECIKNNNVRGSLAQRFTDALQGLPSYFELPYMNYEIACLMCSIGYDVDLNDDDSICAVADKYWAEIGRICADEFNK